MRLNLLQWTTNYLLTDLCYGSLPEKISAC